MALTSPFSNIFHMNLKSLEILENDQSIYDGFNSFILSPDTKVFGKLLARSLIFDSIKNIPGDILEFGVFKGTGLLTLLKLKKFLCPNSSKKIVGFDFFNSESLISSLSGQDKEAMSTLFNGRNFEHTNQYAEYLKNLILRSGFVESEFDLVPGDVSQTVVEYLKERPGLKISMLYLDLDLEKPTYDVLQSCWDRVSKGGVVVFDEYAYHFWSESIGADKFFADKDVEIQSLNYHAPTALVVKK